MSELKRNIGFGLIAEWHGLSECISVSAPDGTDSIYFTETTLQNLLKFRAYVQTELASRQRFDDGFNGPDFNQSERLKPLPEIKPITTVLKKLTP